MSSELQEQVDKFLIGEIERDFHEALSKKDIDQMMSLWSQNATFTAGSGKTATGKQQIQQFWLKSEAFNPRPSGSVTTRRTSCGPRSAVIGARCTSSATSST